MKILDDFLPIQQFQSFQQLFFDKDFPWFYNDSLANLVRGQDQFQLTHSFFDIRHPFKCTPSKSKSLLLPLLTKLSPKYILRIKANLRPRTSNPVLSPFHTDTDIPHTTAIFYINSNNGYTLFKDDSKVFSKANRLLLFDSSLEHSGASCTDQNDRIVLNINYIPDELDPLR